MKISITFLQNNYDTQVDIVLNPNVISEDKNIANISALWFYKKM